MIACAQGTCGACCGLQVSNQALEGRHWEQIFTIMGRPYLPDTTFCIKDLLEWVLGGGCV